MTQDEIIRMATEVWGYSEWKGAPLERLQRFAALVAAHEREKHRSPSWETVDDAIAAEREACAKVCEEMWAGGYGPSAITAAIRARGEK